MREILQVSSRSWPISYRGHKGKEPRYMKNDVSLHRPLPLAFTDRGSSPYPEVDVAAVCDAWIERPAHPNAGPVRPWPTYHPGIGL